MRWKISDLPPEPGWVSPAQEPLHTSGGLNRLRAVPRGAAPYRARIHRSPRGRAAPALHAAALLVVLLAIVGRGGVPCLAGGDARASVSGPIAESVPEGAGLFLHIRDAQALESVFRRAFRSSAEDAGLTSGRPAEAAGGNDDAVARLLQGLTRPPVPRRPSAAHRGELAIVAPSWRDLRSSSWLVRGKDPGLVNEWFDPGLRRESQASGGIQSFLVADELRVAVRGDLLLISPQEGDGGTWERTIALWRGKGGRPLSADPLFERLTGQLPAGSLATVYVNPGASGSQPPSSASAWPALRLAAIGMYERDGRLEFAVRGARHEDPPGNTAIPRPVASDLLHLPRTTLLAWATTFDLEETYRAAADVDKAPTLGRYVRYLRSLVAPGPIDASLFGGIGPGFILAWGHGLGGSNASPQLAVMIECANAEAVREEAARVAGTIAHVLETIDTREPGSGPLLLRSSYLGTEIVEMPLASYAQRSRLPVAPLLAPLTPSFAAVDRWLVIALSPEHIRRIIQARHGLVATLEAEPDAVRAVRRSDQSGDVLVVQAALASDIVGEWLDGLEAGRPSLLDTKWWRPAQPQIARKLRQIGIGMKARQRPGVVEVARVYPHSAAVGRIEPGDLILGVDGQLLAMQQPNGDLRRRLAESSRTPGPLLRIQRAEELLDVELELEPSGEPEARLLPPAEAMRELAVLGSYIECATLTVRASTDDDYRAHVTVRLGSREAGRSSAQAPP